MCWTLYSFAMGRRAVGGVVLALGSVLVHAAEPAASSPAPAKAPVKSAKQAAPADVLTRDELRACMAQNARRKEMRQNLLTQRTALDKEGADIQRESKALKESLETLDRTSEAAVQAYQARAAANDQLIDPYQARLASFDTAAVALNNEDQAYIDKCSGRAFEERDELAIKRGKK